PPRDQPGNGPGQRRPGGRFRVTLVAGSAAQPTSELETQLRKRLRFCALLAVAYCAAEIGIGLPFALPRLLAAPLEDLTRPPWYGLLFLIGCLEGVIAARLSSRRPTDLARLRALEWLALLPVIAYSGWGATYTLADSWPRIAEHPVGTAIDGTNPWGLLAV